jgi:hypothetical protein
MGGISHSGRKFRYTGSPAKPVEGDFRIFLREKGRRECQHAND